PNVPATSGTPVSGPSRASVSVRAAGRVFEHWAITSGTEADLASGVFVSGPLTNCVCVLLLPWLSLKVQVIVWSPWPKGPVTSARSEERRVGEAGAVGAGGRAAKRWARCWGRQVPVARHAGGR